MGWSETDNRAISVQLNLTGTATGTELCNKHSNMKRIEDNNRMQNALRSFLSGFNLFSLLMYKWVVSGHVVKLSFWIIHATWPHLVLV